MTHKDATHWWIEPYDDEEGSGWVIVYKTMAQETYLFGATFPTKAKALEYGLSLFSFSPVGAANECKQELE